MQDEQAEQFRTRYPGAIILPYKGAWPDVAESAYVAPTAVVIGNVTIGDRASVWYQTTVRGDIAPISIGAGSNVQDNTVVHVNADAPVRIGDDVTIGHSAIIHGTTIGDATTIGMGAIVMSYTTIGSHCVIAAGALVTERTVVEDGSVMIGVPAKVRSALNESQRAHLDGIAARYTEVAATHRGSVGEVWRHEH